MFIDYYVVLEVDENATPEEIKTAFKKQALKWHPDRNIGINTTEQMQEINEAYLILKDKEARDRYNIEYQRFKEYKRRIHQTQDNYQNGESKNSWSKKNQKGRGHSYYNFYSNDEILNGWMNNAKRQAVDLAKQAVEDTRGMISVGVKSGIKDSASQFIYLIIGGVILSIIFGLTKGCG